MPVRGRAELLVDSSGLSFLLRRGNAIVELAEVARVEMGAKKLYVPLSFAVQLALGDEWAWRELGRYAALKGKEKHRFLLEIEKKVADKLKPVITSSLKKGLELHKLSDVDFEVGKALDVKINNVVFIAMSSRIGADEVAAKFGLMALIDDAAIEFHRKVANSGLTRRAKLKLIDLAAEKGLEAAEEKLGEYLARRPSGKATVLRDDYGVVVGDGVNFVMIEVRSDKQTLSLKESLQENVYADDVRKVYSFGSLGAEELKVVIANPDDFLKFALRVKEVEEALGCSSELLSIICDSSKVLHVVCRCYFNQRELAEKLLVTIEEVAEVARAGTAIMGSLWDGVRVYCKKTGVMGSYVKLANGYLVLFKPRYEEGFKLCFVSNEKDFHVFDAATEITFSFVAGHLAKHGKPPKFWREPEMEELSAIAIILREELPELVISFL